MAAQIPSVGGNCNQGFMLCHFAISAIQHLLLYSRPDHCGADRVTARASVISNLY